MQYLHILPFTATKNNIPYFHGIGTFPNKTTKLFGIDPYEK